MELVCTLIIGFVLLHSCVVLTVLSTASSDKTNMLVIAKNTVSAVYHLDCRHSIECITHVSLQYVFAHCDLVTFQPATNITCMTPEGHSLFLI